MSLRRMQLFLLQKLTRRWSECVQAQQDSILLFFPAEQSPSRACF